MGPVYKGGGVGEVLVVEGCFNGDEFKGLFELMYVFFVTNGNRVVPCDRTILPYVAVVCS